LEAVLLSTARHSAIVLRRADEPEPEPDLPRRRARPRAHPAADRRWLPRRGHADAHL